jgi:hypothetical protein
LEENTCTSPSRREVHKNKAPDTPFTTVPVITLWGTGFDATVYYAENFKTYCSLVNRFCRDDVSSIGILQEISNDSN